MAKTMSTKEMLEKIINGEEITPEIIEKAKEMLKSVKSRDSKRAEKSNETRSANSAVALEIYDLMKVDTWYAISEIVEKLIPETTHNKNKISAIMKQGVTDGIFEERNDYRVDNKGDKKKGYMRIETDTAETEETEETAETTE